MLTDVHYRPASSADTPFIISSWVDSYRHAHAAGMIPMPLYERIMRECVAWVMMRPDVSFIVACHPQHLDDLYGWCCSEGNLLLPSKDGMRPTDMRAIHFCYVKQAYRRLGVGRDLFHHSGVDVNLPFIFTCKTAAVSKCRLYANGEWQPLLARYPKETKEKP